MAGAISCPALRTALNSLATAPSAPTGQLLYEAGVKEVTKSLGDPCVLIFLLKNSSFLGLMTFTSGLFIKSDLIFLVEELGYKMSEVSLVGTGGYDTSIYK